MFYTNINEISRQTWLKQTLGALPTGARILDAGAGELRNRQHCGHLDYVSQDFCQYHGEGEGTPNEGFQSKGWDTTRVDLVSDIAAIDAPAASFDAILCNEVLEHAPEPTHALAEFARLLKPRGKLILTAPFGSLVHMAPFHYCGGFGRYWYEYHHTRSGFEIAELTPNGDWFACCKQDLMRLGSMARRYDRWNWPIAYALGMLGALYFGLGGGRRADDLACFGWHCLAARRA